MPKSEFERVKGNPELEVIDATCTWVLQSQKAARELAEAGYTVCIIGHEDHPEVRGVRSYAGDKHVVVDDMDRSTWERVPRTKKIGVLSQSTILPNKLEEFAKFCEADGWTRQPIKGEYEVLRMTHATRHPLIVHTRLQTHAGNDVQHLTLHGTAESMFSKWQR